MLRCGSSLIKLGKSGLGAGLRHYGSAVLLMIEVHLPLHQLLVFVRQVRLVVLLRRITERALPLPSLVEGRVHRREA